MGDLSRRGVLGLGAAAALGGCTPDPDPTPTGGSPPSSTPSSAATEPVHDPGWVRTENARPGDDGWAMTSRTRAGDDLVGYASAASIRPGEPLDLHISSARGEVRVSAYRVGHYGGKGGRRVHVTTSVPGRVHEVPEPDERGAVRCRWPVAATLPTDGWPEGLYLLVLEAKGRKKYIPLTVRSAGCRDRLVVMCATTTYQAYNEFGGASLYHGVDATGERTFAGRAREVSFERPYDGNGASIVMKYEHAPVRLAEELGLDLAYVTSGDVDAEPGLLDGAAGVVSLGHDEYWSVPMREAVEAARDAGTNLAFLGANACYWRVRLEDEGRTVVCTKSADEDPGQGAETTTLWRSAPSPRPEHSLVGMLYEAFPAVGPLVVHDPSSWLLRGTGARRGSSYPGLVGSEVDRAYPIAGTPPTLQVVAHSPTPLAGGRTTHSDLTYYTVPSGAGVVATGTMSWCYGIRGEYPELGITAASVRLARQVTRTLLTQMARGPLGERHPSRPNLDSLDASASTATGTGGPVGREP